MFGTYVIFGHNIRRVDHRRIAGTVTEVERTRVDDSVGGGEQSGGNGRQERRGKGVCLVAIDGCMSTTYPFLKHY